MECCVGRWRHQMQLRSPPRTAARRSGQNGEEWQEKGEHTAQRQRNSMRLSAERSDDRRGVSVCFLLAKRYRDNGSPTGLLLGFAIQDGGRQQSGRVPWAKHASEKSFLLCANPTAAPPLALALLLLTRSRHKRREVRRAGQSECLLPPPSLHPSQRTLAALPPRSNPSSKASPRCSPARSLPRP